MTVLQQPRAENNYQAKSWLLDYLSKSGQIPVSCKLLLTWKDVLPDPTPTPWPTLSPNAPTPTPASAPKVLWIVLQGMMTAVHEQYKMDLDQFRDIFTAVGAAKVMLLSPVLPSLILNCLNGYAACDIW